MIVDCHRRMPLNLGVVISTVETSTEDNLSARVFPIEAKCEFVASAMRDGVVSCTPSVTMHCGLENITLREEAS